MQVKMPILYCALPTRLRERSAAVRLQARQAGCVPVVPFDLGPYDDFEGNPGVGRERTIQLMFGLQDACDECGIFGISRGVLAELSRALDKSQPVRTFPGLDPQWDTMYEQLGAEYGHPLERLRGPYELIVVAGPRAVGKTYWIDAVVAEHPNLQRVKTTTTREPRNEYDHESYNFVSEEEFRARHQAGEFLESDTYRGARYGSSLAAIKAVLQTSHGVMAMTPSGVEALWRLRYEINVRTIAMRAANRAMMEKNFDRRGITSESERGSLWGLASSFALPLDIVAQTLALTGNTSADEPQVREALRPRSHVIFG